MRLCNDTLHFIHKNGTLKCFSNNNNCFHCTMFKWIHLLYSNLKSNISCNVKRQVLFIFMVFYFRIDVPLSTTSVVSCYLQERVHNSQFELEAVIILCKQLAHINRQKNHMSFFWMYVDNFNDFNTIYLNCKFGTLKILILKKYCGICKR